MLLVCPVVGRIMVSMAVSVSEAVAGRWPTPGTIRGQWTAADLDGLPDDGLRYELVDGTLIVSPAPSLRHQWVSAALFGVLRSARPSSLEVLYAPVDWRPEGRTSVQPDLLVIRLPADIDGTVSDPLLLVEVSSPSSQVFDRVVKFETYALAGVPQYWIVDPGAADRAPSVEVFDLVAGEYRLQVRATGDETVSVDGPVPVVVTPSALVTVP